MQTRHRANRRTRPAGAGEGHLLYARPGIVVTVARFSVGRQSYPIAELTHLRTDRGPHDRFAVRVVAATAAVIGATGVLLGFTGGLERLTAGAYLALGAFAVLPVLLALAGDWWRPPPYELWGWYRGVETLLFSSDDQGQFDEVTAALDRARDRIRYADWEGAADRADPWRPDR
ncbi:DUF6232 family protein [Micromonospora mirobrigensis]|uniref:DUF6232 family protein n=1 Tax=Micromonospora mirobrigensis TaxID=262898 RepID=UPI000B896002|nr:DUF6232 family protein [Micromonospora mirobrigensis]